MVTTTLPLLLLWLLLLVSGSTQENDYLNVQIMGGDSIEIRKRPFQASLWSGLEFRGSGAVLGDAWMLTTASIVTGFEASSLLVRTGSSSATSGGHETKVMRVFIHPKFSFINMTHDVALLRLQQTLSTAKIILANRPLHHNTKSVLSGWGSTTNQTKMTDKLRQILVSPMLRRHCQQAYQHQVVIGSSQFCARAIDGYGPCWGDNGDLLTHRGRLYGILSWNRGCFTEALPSLFTKISSVRSWIKRVTRRHCTSI